MSDPEPNFKTPFSVRITSDEGVKLKELDINSKSFGLTRLIRELIKAYTQSQKVREVINNYLKTGKLPILNEFHSNLESTIENIKDLKASGIIDKDQVEKMVRKAYEAPINESISRINQDPPPEK